MRWDLLFIEITSVVLFCLGLFYYRKAEKGRALEFFMMAVYGLILEELDMRIFKSYHYSPDFVLTFMNVPVSIALLWAVILAGSMAITDKLGLPKHVKPFMDAILAVWIDLSLDAIAIRLEYWTWAIPIDEGWFGVPAGNLYAWMWVAFAYSILARWLREKIKYQPKWTFAYIPLPIFAYIVLFVSMAFVGFLGKLLGFESQNQRLILFGVQFFIFAVIVLRAWSERKTISSEPREVPMGLWKWSRFFMHVYFLIAYFVIGTYRELPILGVLAAFIFIGEIYFLEFTLKREYHPEVSI